MCKKRKWIKIITLQTSHVTEDDYDFKKYYVAIMPPFSTTWGHLPKGTSEI